MPTIVLSPAERSLRRGEAHHLHPVVTIGADGLSAAVLKEADTALSAHGLIKLRVFNDDRAEREALLARLADALNAAPVQHIGKLLVLWRPLPDKPRTERPEERMAGPRTVKLVKFGKSPTHRPQVKVVRVLGNQRVTAGGSIKRAKNRPTSLKKKAGAKA
jgi:putative YhbY family RNA-binding protein